MIRKFLYKLNGKFCSFLAQFSITHKWPTFWWKRCGYSIGNNVRIASGCTFWAWPHLDKGNIIIEDNVSIGPRVMLITRTHSTLQVEEFGKTMSSIPGKIVIKNGAWIGAGAIILPNISVGECSIVGAGAVVTKNVPPFSVVVGVPARIIHSLEAKFENKSKDDSKIQ